MEPYSTKYPKYRLSLFSEKFFVRFEDAFLEPDQAVKHRDTNILLSFSPGLTTHPYAARQLPSHVNVYRDICGDQRLNRIGVRLSGLHSTTREPYTMWVPVGDIALQCVLKIYDRITDQERLQALCNEAYEKYVTNAKEG
jgi:hypothetical protein